MNFLQKVLAKRGINKFDTHNHIREVILTACTPEKLIAEFAASYPRINIGITCTINIPKEIYEKEYIAAYGNANFETIITEILRELQIACDELINIYCEIHYTSKNNLSIYTQFYLLMNKSECKKPVSSIVIGETIIEDSVVELTC